VAGDVHIVFQQADRGGFGLGVAQARLLRDPGVERGEIGARDLAGAGEERVFGLQRHCGEILVELADADRVVIAVDHHLRDDILRGRDPA